MIARAIGICMISGLASAVGILKGFLSVAAIFCDESVLIEGFPYVRCLVRACHISGLSPVTSQYLKVPLR
jgi:hypothetical protein